MTKSTVKTQITTISTVFKNVLKRWELYFCCQIIYFSQPVTCMATLSHLPPLDNSLIQSWSPPWFLWSWQLHKLDRERSRSWVISGARLQYFSPPPLSRKLRSKSCKFSLLKVSQTNDKHKTDGVTSNLETDQVCKIPRMGNWTEWGKLSF